MRIISTNTLVIGSGASGLGFCDRLFSLGQRSVILCTENMNYGTSRNTGSDKQTYYKISLCGADRDSVDMVAESLYGGGCVDGDTALCEAALSAPCFLRLAELGVPFPTNEYGEYVGYKTDHDPCRRGSSVGPYTSKVMTELLEAAVRRHGVTIEDNTRIVHIFSKNGQVYGALGIRTGACCAEERYTLFLCRNIVLATGGPAGMYSNSVYPESQFGGSGIAYEAGASGQNLTEWQFGLASVSPRWNVSGTYMQALPSFISTEQDGSDECEFLFEEMPNIAEALSRVFLKGYQWPFDVSRTQASSMIDLLVYREKTIRGRRVFLDYTRNPGNGSVPFDELSAEAREYLEKNGACFGIPIERLMHMNAPAVAFYREHGVDLAKDRLEIALCVQHNNGGISVDRWWQTEVKGLFAIGEAAGTHGIKRPGGSALNAGQVGAARAAQYIAAKCSGSAIAEDEFDKLFGAELADIVRKPENAVGAAPNVLELTKEWSERMSRAGGPVRVPEHIKKELPELREFIGSFDSRIRIADMDQAVDYFKLRDMLICQYVYLFAMYSHVEAGGKSRGSAIYKTSDNTPGSVTVPWLFSFEPETEDKGQIQQIYYRNGECTEKRRDPRPLPQRDKPFEAVWQGFRADKNIF